MSEPYDEDNIDIGSPLKFEIDTLKLDAESETVEDLNALSFRCVIKDALDDETDLYEFTDSDDALRFNVVNGVLYFCALDKTETAALEAAITPTEEQDVMINNKKLIGVIYLTLSFFDDDLGPENIIHLKLNVLKPAI